MNLATALELAAHRYPETEAIITPEKTYTYKEWNERVNAAAWQLYRHGLKEGDRLAICAANGEAPATLYFAAHKTGATAVFFHARWKHEQIAYAIAEANVKAIFYDRSTKDEANLALERCGRKVIRIEEGGGASPNGSGSAAVLSYDHMTAGPLDQAPPVARSDAHTGTILYTSGTTGRPKGVCRSCRSDYYASLAIILGHRWSPFERILAVMPLYHTMGLHTLISMVLLNGASVLLPRAEPSACLRHIEINSVTALYLVPTVFHNLVQFITNNEKKKIPVRKLAYAGAPMPPPLVVQCFAVFSPDVFVNQYGSTEMLAISFNPDLKQKPASAGRPGLHTLLRLVTPRRERRALPHETVPQGAIGEIIVNAGPQAFQGYLNGSPEKEAGRREDGWYYTGDLGYLDEEGDLHLAGRIDHMIISGGENIYPAEVENVLIAHPGVKEAAVVGRPDERWGEIVAAFIVPRSQKLDSRALDEHCLAGSLARYKRPREYYFVESIPRSPAGKILYRDLKERLESGAHYHGEEIDR
ncbi:class I adenylate-forming enzyme family protein [Candidatus Darwinibacter acetoxidans]